MLRTFSEFLRKRCNHYLVGLPLFFITVSPYSSSHEKEKDAVTATPEAQHIAQNVKNALLSNALDTDDTDTMGTTATDTGVSDLVNTPLYNVYLAKAPVMPQYEAPPANYPLFMPLNDAPEIAAEERAAQYEQLLDAYLAKIETMVDKNGDYLTALEELDKVQLVAPADRRIYMLRQKIRRLLKKELEEGADRVSEKNTPQKGVAPVPTVPKVKEDIREEKGNTPESLDVITEKALQEAEAKMLREKADTLYKKYGSLPAPSKKESVVPQEKAEKKESAVPAQKKVPATAARTNEDGAIITPVMFMKNEPLRRRDVETDVAKPSVVVLPQNDGTDEVESPAKSYVIKGKRYFRHEQYALALISFSKAKEHDDEGKYSAETTQLIRLAKDRLEEMPQ